jgi:hypothetical protein
MKIESTSQVLGWDSNTRITEIRHTYQYEQGNNVTVVERRNETFPGYDAKGRIEEASQTGSLIDRRV